MTNEASSDFSLREFSKLTGMTQALAKRTLEDLPADASFSAIAAALVNASKADAQTDGTGSRVSISDLSRLTGLDRATVAKRIGDLDPTPGPKNSALYQLAEALPRLFGDDAALDDFKSRKIAAEAELKEMERDELLGKIAPVDQFTEVLIRIFSSMYQQIAVRYPVEASAKLAKAKTSTAVATIMRKDFAAIFGRLRTNFKEFLEPESSN